MIEKVCDGVYYIESGTVDVVLNGENVLAINNGEAFGKSKLIKQAVSIYSF